MLSQNEVIQNSTTNSVALDLTPNYRCVGDGLIIQAKSLEIYISEINWNSWIKIGEREKLRTIKIVNQSLKEKEKYKNLGYSKVGINQGNLNDKQHITRKTYNIASTEDLFKKLDKLMNLTICSFVFMWLHLGYIW